MVYLNPMQFVAFISIGFCIVQRPRQSDQLISVNNARRVRISFSTNTSSLSLLLNLYGIFFFFSTFNLSVLN